MKILMVSIPNHHFQWVDQLKDCGYDVIWFDASDGGSHVEELIGLKIKDWKLKWNFPMRHSLKQYFPLFYKGIQKWNERDIADVFENIIQKYQPNIVHSFEMRLVGLPILAVMQNIKIFPLFILGVVIFSLIHNLE
jgi:hypothetical protein